MDPNKTLEEALALAEKIQRDAAMGRTIDPYAAMELADRMRNLDQWIVRGGFFPSRWDQGVERELLERR